MNSLNNEPSKGKRLREIFKISSLLGFTSFGGPVAHLGFFQNEYVKKRKWLDDHSYANLVALCQFLPGPASSQVGIAIGMIRGGLLGGVISWLGFTLPSVIALVLFAYLYQSFDLGGAGWIHGLKIVAVAVVAQAIMNMGKKLAPDRPRISIAILSAIFILILPTAISQLALILIAGLVGLILYKNKQNTPMKELKVGINRKIGVFAWVLFFGLLIGLPILRQLSASQSLAIFDTFYRVGSLVFGGGHVVLPMLEREVVPSGWITKETFLAGYGAAQAVPGPLFTFSGYLGAIINGWKGATIATIAIFLPSFLLIIGTLPFWDMIRKYPYIQSVLMGVNAGVLGILLAALYDPIFTSAIATPVDFALAIAAFTLLVYWKVPAWLVVILAALGGAIVGIL
ncbi:MULTISPECIES: chromate transporter [Bacillaceae]|uniref:chromate transporter n=1 Tax=Bacillaceae TaxID=186817 RepID=UPI002A12E254|nr:chromate transporter [Cytobacillus sp. IB215316]MDX8362054.1 chromate transporter [Cytobacillus sp. IB215316]